MSELKKKLEKALNLLEKANAAHPDSADTHIFQADARKALNEALSLLPEWVSVSEPPTKADDVAELLASARDLAGDVDAFVEYVAVARLDRCTVCGRGFDANSAVKHQPTCKLVRLQRAIKAVEGKA